MNLGLSWVILFVGGDFSLTPQGSRWQCYLSLVVELFPAPCVVLGGIRSARIGGLGYYRWKIRYSESSLKVEPTYSSHT